MTSDQPETGLLINFPLKFAGATPDVIVNPAPPAGVPVEGLPQASFREVVGLDGNRDGAARAVVDPPTGGEYTAIALYMKGPRDSARQFIDRKDVSPDEQNDRTYFEVYQSLLGDGVHVFTYDVERASGNSGPSTESWALYHRDLPGGNDVPGTGPHPNLAISLPAELGEPPRIGKEEMDAGVPCTLSYIFRRAYDQVTLELNRYRFYFTVQPEQVGKPYVITITREMFELAGNSPRFAISYTVVDQLNNPTDKRRWSKVIEADVDTERVTLEPAVLREIPTENNDDSSIVDLTKMKGGPLWALIHLVDRVWRAGDEIHLKFTAMFGGSEVATHAATMPITQVPGQFSWEIPNNKVIADSRVEVVYEQVRGGAVIGTSKAATAQVVGEVVPILSEDFEAYPDGTIFPAGERTELPSMYVTVSPGVLFPARITSGSAHTPGINDGKSLYAIHGSIGTTRLDFKATYSAIRFGAVMAGWDQSQFIYRTYDAQENLLEEKIFVNQGIVGIQQTLIFSKPGIVRLDLRHDSAQGMPANLVVDKFVFTP
ncbi:hypothetical protein [Pseudomonas fluorescens]|uniref:hypothetical protein n=1 Tax=Pseudomonas fluorescens TaxID=294 RepID=UPI0007D0B152|nr:hypothetical protein [Pseudomonas fluorescens]